MAGGEASIRDNNLKQVFLTATNSTPLPRPCIKTGLEAKQERHAKIFPQTENLHVKDIGNLLMVLQFAPSYSDYVLYSDGGPADNVKRKYRGQKGQKQKKGMKGGLDFGDSKAPSRLGHTPQPNAKAFETTR